jgi:hypothetical protein
MYATKLCLPNHRSRSSRTPRRHGPHRDRDQVRAQWIAGCHAHLATSDIKLARTADYQWLRIHDRQWLQDNFPTRPNAKKQAGTTNDRQFSPGRTRIEDKSLALKIATVSNELTAQVGRPKRITLGSLCARIPELKAARRHLPELPYSANALQRAVETFEDCAVRRIAFVASSCRRTGRSVTCAQLALEAGVFVPRYQNSPRVQSALQEAIMTISPITASTSE